MELLPKEVEQAGQTNAKGVGGKIVPVAAAASGKVFLAQLHQTAHQYGEQHSPTEQCPLGEPDTVPVTLGPKHGTSAQIHQDMDYLVEALHIIKRRSWRFEEAKIPYQSHTEKG